MKQIISPPGEYRFFFFLLVIHAFFLSCSKTHVDEKHAAQDMKPLQIQSDVDKAVLMVGDIFVLTVTIKSRPDLLFDVPEFGTKISDFRIMDAGMEDALVVNGRKIQRKWYKLKADIAGDFRIPEMSLDYKLPGNDQDFQAETSSIFIKVKSTLEGKKNLTDLPNDIKSLEKIESGHRKIIIGVVVLLALLIICLAVVYYKKRKSEESDEKPLSAHEQALLELRELKRKKRNNSEMIRSLYFDLSEIFRRYLQNRFDFPAVDWTAEEIQYFIQKKPEISKFMKEASHSFFRNTDRVKFARHFPNSSEIEKEFEAAEKFINDTKEKPEEEAIK